MFPTSGPLVVCVTLMVVTGQTSSPRTLMVGSGQPTKPDWLPQTAGVPSTTGQPPEGKCYPDSEHFLILILASDSTPLVPSQTTGSRCSREERLSPAWRSSITSTETASSGTTWPVITRSPSFARTLKVTSPSPGKHSPTSGSLEQPISTPTYQPRRQLSRNQQLLPWLPQ